MDSESTKLKELPRAEMVTEGHVQAAVDGGKGSYHYKRIRFFRWRAPRGTRPKKMLKLDPAPAL